MKVTIHKYKHPTLTWKVTVTDHGKGPRKFFATKEEAEAYAHRKRIEIQNEGNRAADLSGEIKMMALKASRILEPYNKTILDAVDFFVQHIKDNERSLKVGDAMAEFLHFKEVKGKSHRYLLDLKSRLLRFHTEFGERSVADITPKLAEDWLMGLDVGNLTRNNYRRVLRTFFEFCVKQGRCRDNPFSMVEPSTVPVKDVEIFTPDAMLALLKASEGDVRAYLAIGAFAGLRDSEIRRLSWEDVKIGIKKIDLTGRITKTAASREVDIPPVLMHFLEPVIDEHGLVCRKGFERRLKAFKRAMAVPSEKGRVAVQWQKNGLRHSFATYHYAINDLEKTRRALGHNGTSLIYKHYRKNRVDVADAQRWFALHTEDVESPKKRSGRSHAGKSKAKAVNPKARKR
jgi:integrase